MQKEKLNKLTPLEIPTLEVLREREAEVVQRINRTPNGGRLFLADPFRLFADVQVYLSAVAQRALEDIYGPQDLAANPLRRLYDDFKQDPPDRAVTVVIRGILPKEGSGNAGHV